MTKDRDAKCLNCKFFEEQVPDAIGRCRREPPSPYIAGLVHPASAYKIEAAAAWPVVRVTDWCGEHLPILELVEDMVRLDI